MLSGQGGGLRIGPWQGNRQVAYVVPVHATSPCSAADVHRAVDLLGARGSASVVTAALAPLDQAAVLTVGGHVRERLHLLARPLPAAPPPPSGGLELRRAHHLDRPAVLDLDHRAFEPFWRLDEVGLDDAIAATPSARFRVAVDAGAEVVKVESTGRPDGARRGDRAFFDLLNAGKRSVALDLPDPKAVAVLQALVDGADLVVEGSRPRALDQLGIVRHRRWVALTAYGASGPWRQWSGFGDDAAVAGGLVGGSPQAPAFYGDAIADPVAGLHAAVAGLAVLVGAPASVDLALREVVNHVIGVAPPGPMPAAGVRRVRPGRAPALGEAVPDGRGAGTRVAR